MMKKDIAANLNQKCLILGSKIPLNVLHNMSAAVWLQWRHTGSGSGDWIPYLPNTKSISGHLWRSILIFANGASCA